MVSFNRIVACALCSAAALSPSSAFCVKPSTSLSTTPLRNERASRLHVASISVEPHTYIQAIGITTSGDDGTQAEKKNGQVGLLARAFRSLSGKKMDRETIAKLSTSVLPAYVLVGSSFAAVAISFAWYIASRSSGLSPLAPGQLRAFLKVYAGFYAFLNLIKPFRIMLAVYLARYFERGVVGMQTRFQCSKPKAVGLMVFLTNICGGVSLLTGGIFTASALSGVPIFA